MRLWSPRRNARLALRAAILLVASAAVCVTPRAAHAQRAHDAGAAVAAPSGTPAARPASAPTSSAAAEANEVAVATYRARLDSLLGMSGCTRGTVARVGGGALLGGALGFFVGKVAISDWDDRSDGATGRRLQRAYVAGGAAVGILGGAYFSRVACRSGLSDEHPRSRPEHLERSGRHVIALDEIQESGAATVYDLVRLRRGFWLAGRGPTSLGAANDEIAVYLDGVALGGPESMRQIYTVNVQFVEFLDASQATYRFGTGNPQGAILVTSASASIPVAKP